MFEIKWKFLKRRLLLERNNHEQEGPIISYRVIKETVFSVASNVNRIDSLSPIRHGYLRGEALHEIDQKFHNRWVVKRLDYTARI